MGNFLSNITKEELNVPQKLIFTGKIPVEFEILVEMKEYENDGKITMEFPLRVLTGEHKDKTHLLKIKRDNQKQFVAFVGAFFTDEQLESDSVKETDLIGKRFRAVPSPVKSYEGYDFNTFSGYQDITPTDEAAKNDEPAPF